MKMLDQSETAVAYRCPACGSTVLSMVGIFTLSGDMIRLKCSCGQSELHVSYTADRKIRITAPCLVCPDPHSFTLGSASFFSDRVFTYHCPMTGLELCFVGKKDDVLAAAADADRALMDLMNEAGLKDLEEIKPENDPEGNEDLYFISDVVRFLLAELREEHAIRCHCRYDSEREIDFRFVTDQGDQKVEIFCSACGASKLIPIVSANDAQSFLTVDRLDLI